MNEEIEYFQNLMYQLSGLPKEFRYGKQQGLIDEEQRFLKWIEKQQSVINELKKDYKKEINSLIEKYNLNI